MKLKLKLGMNEPNRIVSWYKGDVTSFPSMVTYKGKKFEFVMYDVDLTGEADYKCMFSELHSYDPAWHSNDFVDIDYMVSDAWSTGCECGAIHTSFPMHHMFFCPKWSKQ